MENPPVPPGEGPQVIPAQIRRVNNLIMRSMSLRSRENGVEEVTPMHGWILGYLYHRRGEEVFQKDIERVFSVTRSTVTSILQLMEKKGYIVRESVPQDARLKRIRITEQGASAHEKMMLTIKQTDEHIASLLTEEENREMLRLLAKLRMGLSED